MSENITTGDAYAFDLLEYHKRLGEMDRQYLLLRVAREIDPDIIFGLHVEMARLWKELKPKFEGRMEDQQVGPLAKKFMWFADFAENPELLSHPNVGRIPFFMAETLRECVEKLGITRFDEAH